MSFPDPHPASLSQARIKRIDGVLIPQIVSSRSHGVYLDFQQITWLKCPNLTVVTHVAVFL